MKVSTKELHMRNARYSAVLLVLSIYCTIPAHVQAQASGPAPPSRLSTETGEPSPTVSQEGGVSLGSVVASIGRDLLHLSSKSTAWTLGVGGALALASMPADRNLTRTAQSSAALDRVFEGGELLGSGWVQAGGAAGTFLAGHITRNRRVQTLGADLMRAQAVNTLLTKGVKVAVGRLRPDGSRFSFPSGHASASFATAAVLQRHFGWKAGAPAYAAAAYVAASRLQENKHYASDVIFGAAVGIVAGRTVTVGRGPARFAVSPAVARGRVGVSFTKIVDR